MSEFTSFDQIANPRDWDDYFRNKMPENPRDMLLHEYPNWSKIPSEKFGPAFTMIEKFVDGECHHTVLWVEDDPYATGEEPSFATLFFKNPLDMVEFELMFGHLTV